MNLRSPWCQFVANLFERDFTLAQTRHSGGTCLFVRPRMTAISAVIFLVSAEYNMATSYIIGGSKTMITGPSPLLIAQHSSW